MEGYTPPASNANKTNADSPPPRRGCFKLLFDLIASGWANLEKSLAMVYEKVIAEHPRTVLAILTLIWLIPGTAQLPFIDRDEPRFAYASQEMIDRGETTVPYFNNECRFDKPPMVYWWMRLNYAIFGYNEFTARLHSILATVAVVLLIWGFASRLYTRDVGFWSAFAFLTCSQVIMHGRLCVADMPMMISIVAAQWAMWELLQRSSWRWAAVFWVALAVGFTTKWVVPWAVTGAAFAAYMVLKRSWQGTWQGLKNLKPISGFIVMTLLILAWAVPAWNATGGDFFKIGIGEHVISRGAAPFNARAYNPFFYLFTAFFTLLPWLAFIGGIFGFLRAGFDNRAKFLAAWAGGTWLLFSLAKTQLPHYALPGFPAILIMIVAATGLKKPAGVWAGRFFNFLLIAWTVVLCTTAVIVVLLPLSDWPIFRIKVAGVFFLAALGGMVGMAWARARGRHLLLLTLFVLVPLIFWGGAVLIDELTPSEEVENVFRREEIPPETLVANGFEEPSLVAYTQASWIYASDYKKAKELYEKAPKSALVVLSEEFTLKNIPELLLRSALHPAHDNERMLLDNPPIGGRRFRMEGLNLGRFSWVTYDLYLKP